MTEMVKAHLGPLGGVAVEQTADADLLLYVNAPAEVQGNGPEQYVLALDDAALAALPGTTQTGVEAFRRRPESAPTLRDLHMVRRDLPEFVRSLVAVLDAGRTCAVVDVAFVNAGDLASGDLLAQEPQLAGWLRTAAGTLRATRWAVRGDL